MTDKQQTIKEQLNYQKMINENIKSKKNEDSETAKEVIRQYKRKAARRGALQESK